jgi:hypothetical protein
MKPILLQDSGELNRSGGRVTPAELENLVRTMRDLATRAGRMGGSDPNVAAVARSLAELGQMTAAIGERLLDVEGRLG